MKELRFEQQENLAAQSFYDNKNFFPFGHKSSKSQSQVAGFASSRKQSKRKASFEHNQAPGALISRQKTFEK